MAESVDALVSNTNAARRAGSTPALGTQNPFRSNFEGVFAFFGKHFRKLELVVKCFFKGLLNALGLKYRIAWYHGGDLPSR